MTEITIPEIGSPSWNTAAQEFILRRVDVDWSGCWIPRLKTDSDGYVRTTFKYKHWFTHRLAFEAWMGPIPHGLVIDHLCRVPACCNPAHLEAVTVWENTLRGDNPMAAKARKTHCKRGHAFTDENTRRRDGRRECWTCHRAPAELAGEGDE